MASQVAAVPVPVPVDPDTLITVKVSYKGGIRRFKLPLRDLGPNVLPGKLRLSLAIPENENVMFERYSDSVAAFVVLDSTNPSVYKQLYRAAKAKLKLRLKATIFNEETASASLPPPPAYVPQVTLITTAPEVPICETTEVQTPEPSKTVVDTIKIDQAVADAVMNYFNGIDYEEKLRSSVRDEVEKQSRAASLASSTVGSSESLPKVPSCSELHNIGTYMVCCNNCDSSIHGTHYHCGTCDGGDYDLCQTCVDEGVHCDQDHWLIKRHLENGQFVSSTTESACKKPTRSGLLSRINTRTCNCCVASLPEECFVTCTVCPDYDVCLPCHITQKHGHHPLHGFAPTTKDTPLDSVGTALLAPGRGTKHHAICDGCDTVIYGVRHKCLNCPDWDFCSHCFETAGQAHAGHRFVPLYEPLNLAPPALKTTHPGIYCDGPLCKTKGHRWIAGDRYKCAVCDDTDFCGDCEAHPSNTHNRTHPLIKLKTPVRHLSCTTDENEGSNVLGDIRFLRRDDHRETTHAATQVQNVVDGSASSESTLPNLLGDIRSFRRNSLKEKTNAATQVQTVADVEPTEEYATKEKEMVGASYAMPSEEEEEEPLQADFLSDTVADGTVMTPGQEFTQTWLMTNSGNTAWPVGVSVRFVGGDHMFSCTSEEALPSFSTTDVVVPGELAAFTVNLVAPEFPRRRVISYWRLTAPDGSRFGHKFWCDISVEKTNVEESIKQEVVEEPVVRAVEIKKEDNVIAPAIEQTMDDSVSSSSSDMVFPKLEKESVILNQDPISSAAPTDTEDETAVPEYHSPINSPAWTLTLSEEEGHTSDAQTSEDDVDSLMLDDEDYEVLETSDDDGYNRVI